MNAESGDPIPQIKRWTDGRGVDVAIEALGKQETFENAPCQALHAGLGDQKIITTLCPPSSSSAIRVTAC